MTLRGACGVTALVWLVGGCAASNMKSLFPEEPTLASRCRLGATQTSVLVTEWSAAEKANLEGLLSGGAVAVAFTGCEMRVLPECRLGGTYGWRRTTPSSDTIEISSEAELFLKLPLGALALAGELKRSGTLFVQTTVSGQMRLDGMTAQDVPINRPECAEATHVVGALTLGAFVLSAGSSGSVGASASAVGVGEGGGTYSRSGRVVRTAGDANTCVSATLDVPAADCSSPIQVFLLPIPGKAPEPGPPGSVRVDFVSASATTRWDIYVDDQATCTTPCSRWVDPNRPLVMRSREDAPDKLRIGRLDVGQGPLQISARPLSRPKLLTGLVATTFGGLGVITGIVLTAVGCSADDLEGMCDAGLITLVPSALVTWGGIWLMDRSKAKFGVRPIFSASTVGFGVVWLR